MLQNWHSPMKAADVLFVVACDELNIPLILFPEFQIKKLV
jgi:hypothetical protein